MVQRARIDCSLFTVGMALCFLSACGSVHAPAETAGTTPRGTTGPTVHTKTINPKSYETLPVLSPAEARKYRSLPWKPIGTPGTGGTLRIMVHLVDCARARGASIERQDGTVEVAVLGTNAPDGVPCTAQDIWAAAKVGWPSSLHGTKIQHAAVPSSPPAT